MIRYLIKSEDDAVTSSTSLPDAREAKQKARSAAAAASQPSSRYSATLAPRLLTSTDT